MQFTIMFIITLYYYNFSQNAFLNKAIVLQQRIYYHFLPQSYVKDHYINFQIFDFKSKTAGKG